MSLFCFGNHLVNHAIKFIFTALLMAPLAALHAAEVKQGETNLPKLKIKTVDHQWQEPPIVDSKYDGALVSSPPGAVILFDGQNAGDWVAIPNAKDTNQSSQFIWKVENGFMEVVTPTGSREQRLVSTKESVITSGHLHIEWATPAVVKGNGQGRGNSGVFIDGFPELQVLDSYNNKTYFDGQAAAFYKYRPPLVNACRGPGLWQCYDIYIQRAKMDTGKVVQPSVITVYHNRVLVQDHLIFSNAVQTSTLRLQDHLNPVRFRNIWFMPGETAAQP
jgi:hypothetical protein